MNKIGILLVIGIYLSQILSAQDSSSKGVIWSNHLTWDQIKSKARAERKYIFLDMYASWCGPCKAMDLNIYPTDKVGNFINESFISAKVQVDTTKNDTEEIRKWYKDAHDLQTKYKVKGFPSFLFFSPEGSIVHRGIGYQNVNDFLNIAQDALDQKKQFYTLLDKYRYGQKDPSVMINLVRILNNMGESSEAFAIAKDYKSTFIDKLDDSALMTKERLSFISSFPKLLNSRDRLFHFFFYEGKKVDSLLGWEGRSMDLVDEIIYRENVYKKLYNEKRLPIVNRPNWKSIEDNVRSKYGKTYADRIVLNSQIEWYDAIKDSALCATYILKKVKKYGLNDRMGLWFNLNAYAWEVFLYSKNRDELNEALKWCDSSIKLNYRSSALDTKANILYKLGRKEQALEYETMAVKKEEEEAEKNKRSPDPNFQKTLERMKNNDPSLYVLEMQELYIIVVS